MRQSPFLSALFAAWMLGAPAAPAAPVTAASAAAGVELEICRVSGSLSDAFGSSIRIPAGTTFRDDAFEADDAASRASGDRPVNVITTAPVAIPASAFCVRAPIRPAGPEDTAALQRSFGRMVVAGGRNSDETPGALDRVYGLLRGGPG